MTREERSKKIQNYLAKKERRRWGQKTAFLYRKNQAKNTVRIKGKFASKKDAFTLLGQEFGNLVNNDSLRNLLHVSNGSSIIFSGSHIKVRNIQALLSYYHLNKETTDHGNSEMKTTASGNSIQIDKLQGSFLEAQAVEEGSLPSLPFEQLSKVSNRMAPDKEKEFQGVLQEIPFIEQPVFSIKRISTNEHTLSHLKYHSPSNC